MEEKILIKSERSQSEKTLKSLITVFFAFFCVFAVILLLPFGEEILGGGYWCAFYFGEYTPLFVLFVIHCLFLIGGVISLIILLVNRKCELTVTDKNVRGKTLHGKEVVLPLYMVSAYSTRKRLSTIVIATSSGLTKFTLIGNYAEIGEVLAKLINDRQANTQATTNESPAQSAQSNSMDDLVKLKSLLDNGIITQEEFDAKKKEILGL